MAESSPPAAVPAAAAGFFAVRGRVRLKAARTSEMPPATTKFHLVAAFSASPVRPDLSTMSNHAAMPCGFAASTFAQSTRMKVKGHAARIHPRVPPMRTRPNSLSGLRILAKAIELVIEMVGT